AAHSRRTWAARAICGAVPLGLDLGDASGLAETLDTVIAGHDPAIHLSWRPSSSFGLLDPLGRARG
ncbi:MAG: hypothetical protein AAGG47_16585, partial [Pseudomonadota bacterium]